MLPKLNLEYWREILLLALMVAVLMTDAFFFRSLVTDPWSAGTATFVTTVP